MKALAFGIDEPFAGMFTQGMVVHETYQKADGSTSAGRSEGRRRRGRHARHVITTGEPVEIGGDREDVEVEEEHCRPDEIIATYGADIARWFMLSDSPPERDVIWTEGASRERGVSCSGSGAW